MTDTEKIKEELKKTIRSLLLSCKDGQPQRFLERDHSEIMGYSIPYRKLGYSSVTDLLDSLPDVCKRTRYVHTELRNNCQY